LQFVNEKRCSFLNKIKDFNIRKGPVLYWMSRDQRVNDNWALIFSQQLSIENKQPLVVVFTLAPSFENAGYFIYEFMLNGLSEVKKTLEKKNIPFFMLLGDPVLKIYDFVISNNIGAVVTDFDPLKVKRKWKGVLAEKLEEKKIPLFEVDAHNLVPCRAASDKKEWGAYTIRPKIERLKEEYTEDFPAVKNNPFPFAAGSMDFDIGRFLKFLNISKKENVDTSVISGEKAALKALNDFLNNKINKYSLDRNDPSKDGCSNLSPYLHFGHICSQSIVLEIERRFEFKDENVKSFLEELIVRKELADNFCFYEKNYDNTGGFPDWSLKTLENHISDKRAYIYAKQEFEESLTHDSLWNAAQRQMVKTAKMNGYMRMYWAKKILEWSPSADEAIKTAIYLNDKYELDGRDPNGYTGISWSIGGVHDRAWGEREVFGKIRYMSSKGAASKFDIKNYINKFKY